jgi:dephospho-CoA kinase
MRSDRLGPRGWRAPVLRAPRARTVKPLRIGITGPIGCGKTTVLGWLAARGATVIDADVVAHEVTGPGSAALEAIRERFGRLAFRPDGSLDRAALGRAVFADAGALRDLEAIVHPLVRARILARIDDARSNGDPVVVIEAIRLVEAGYPALLDETWLIVCDGASQRARLAGRGLPPDEVDRRIAAQAGLAERARAVATREIDTSGSPAEAEARVAEALRGALDATASLPG